MEVIKGFTKYKYPMSVELQAKVFIFETLNRAKVVEKNRDPKIPVYNYINILKHDIVEQLSTYSSMVASSNS